MKNPKLILMALLCLILNPILKSQTFSKTYGMHELHFSEDATKISRQYVLHDSIVFVAPDYPEN